MHLLALRHICYTSGAQKNAAVIKSLERLFGEIRKAEAKTTDRIYIPRTKILEEIEPGTGKAESIEGR